MFDSVLWTFLGIYGIAGLLTYALLTAVTHAAWHIKIAMSVIWPLIIVAAVRYAFNSAKISTAAKLYMPYLIAIHKDTHLNVEQRKTLRDAVYQSMKQGIFPPEITKNGKTITLDKLGIGPRS